MLKDNTIIKTFTFVLGVLSQREKIKALFVLLLLFINSCAEVLGLAALLPLFKLLLEPNFVETNEYVNYLFESFNFGSSMDFIIFICILVVVIFLGKNTLSLFILNYQSKFALGLSKKLGMKLHLLFHSYGYGFFKNNSSHKISHNVNVVTQRFAQNQVLGLINLLNEIVVFSIMVMGIALYDANILLLILCTIVPVFLFFYGLIRKKIIKMGQEYNTINPKLFKDIYQSIFGYVDVLITGTLNNFRSKIGEGLSSLVRINVKRTVYNRAPTKVIEMALVTTICLIVVYSTVYRKDISSTTTLLGVFAVSGYRILPSVNRIMIALMGLKENEYTFEVLGQLKYASNHIQKAEEQNTITFNDKIEANNIHYCYDDSDKSVLNGLTFSVKKGEIIGVIGPSGSGKSTLLNLLLGFYYPTKGTIKIDGINLDKTTVSNFHKKVGYVQQQVYLIDGTIAENIAFGLKASAIDEAKVNEVLKQASLEEFVRTLNLGIHTPIGENGTKLSGGQRQRVGIARALYHNAEILFFDEATSALDTETEEEITEAINKLNDGNITMFIVAHRVSTLKNCSRIFEMDKGLIIHELSYSNIRTK